MRCSPLLIFLQSLFLLTSTHALANPQTTTTTTSTANAGNPYPFGVDPSEKYWPPGSGPPSKRWLAELAANLSMSMPEEFFTAIPTIRKMGFDEGEKFWSDYWSFGDGEDESPRIKEEPLQANEAPRKKEGKELLAFSPPLRQLSAEGVLNLLRRANFACTTGTQSCESIGRPSVCCQASETCVKIPDQGYGDVGCCPTGKTCSGNLSGCSSNQVTCGMDVGGGCCNSGYKCTANGCVSGDDTTTRAAVGGAGGVVGGGGSSAATPTVATTTCDQDSYLCPSMVGGGCCPSGRLCGVSDCPAPTATAVTLTECPPSYYSCAAEFRGGCCRVGRACGVSDCPASGATTTSATTRCAAGWAQCAESVGGGCCPSGYRCNANDCPGPTIIATLTGGRVVTSTMADLEKGAVMTAAAESGVVRKVVVVVALVVGVVGARV